MQSNKQFIDADDVLDFDDTEVEESPSVSEKTPIKEELKEESKPSNIIQSKPILEVNEVEENPFTKYKKTIQPTPKKPRKKQLKQDISVKKLISISQKNIQVVEILKNLPKEYPSDSEYICQAIIEKYERENENKNADIKTLVKNALEELVGEKYIIMKGSSDIQVGQPVYAPNNSMPVINQSSINKAISVKDEEEKESLLLGLIDDLDDDD